MFNTMSSPPSPTALAQFVGRRALADITGYRDGSGTSIGSGGADLADDVGSIQGAIADDDGGAPTGPGRALRPDPNLRPRDHCHLSDRSVVRGTRRVIGPSISLMNTSSSVLLYHATTPHAGIPRWPASARSSWINRSDRLHPRHSPRRPGSKIVRCQAQRVSSLHRSRSTITRTAPSLP